MPSGSLFRRPGDSSSSEDESTDHALMRNASADVEQFLSRINALGSTRSAVVSGSDERLLTTSAAFISTTPRDKLRDSILHGLIEEKVLREAADFLGKDQSDPEVQDMAKVAYVSFAHQFDDLFDQTYARDEMSAVRATAAQGVNRLASAVLDDISAKANAVGTAAAAGVSQALVPKSLSYAPDDGIQALTANLDLLLGLRAPIPMSLHNLQGLHTDRYTRDYTEIEMVGKGGYGKVYKVKHKLDDTFYAVKRIMVSPSKLRSITEQGASAHEMENMLKEVRSLARLDHHNIVRYFNAWLEYSPTTATGEFVRHGLVLTDAPTESATTSAYGADYPELSQYSDMGIVFEKSDADAEPEELPDQTDDVPLSKKAAKRKARRESEATITSLPSIKSLEGAGEGDDADKSVQDEADEEDVEVIPRNRSPTLEDTSSFISDRYTHQRLQSRSINTDFFSDMPNQLVKTRHGDTFLTLNIQMSLYDINLSAFLSSEKPGPTHCYHTCISLELLGSIVTGVQYLHSMGVVHRDLKPANIFLSLSTASFRPSNSVDLSSCDRCHGRDCLYVTPKIGDFGLVAALGDNATSKPVGTEFYRPPFGGSISEKLDVYALGVMTFEMLESFGTRMERVESLTKMRRGELPEGFGELIGGTMGRKVEGLLAGMLRDDEEMRWSCKLVKEEVSRIVEGYKAK
jgi:translation initiation factor 2-alpha kinase 3